MIINQNSNATTNSGYPTWIILLCTFIRVGFNNEVSRQVVFMLLLSLLQFPSESLIASPDYKTGHVRPKLFVDCLPRKYNHNLVLSQALLITHP